jgi:hypothetical protein
MSDVHNAAQPGGDGASLPDTPVDTFQLPADTPAVLSPREAASALSKARWAKRDAQNKQEAPSAAPELAAVELPEPVSGDEPEIAAQPEGADPGEVTETIDPVEVPSIEPPRSWPAADKEAFQALPPEIQQRVADRESKRESEFLKQQEAVANERKAAEAERAQVNQTRQQYEATLPALLQALHQQQAGDFSDIKTMADVETMAKEDPFRYSQWDFQQKKIAAVTQEMQSAQQRQNAEYQQQWSKFAAEQDKLTVEHIPELANHETAQKLQTAAIETLSDLGFSRDELAPLWNGQASLSLRDHRVQRMMYESMKWREAKAKAKAVTAKPIPQVQRPGVAQPAGAADAQRIKTLEAQLDKTGSIKDALALQQAKRKVAAR